MNTTQESDAFMKSVILSTILNQGKADQLKRITKELRAKYFPDITEKKVVSILAEMFEESLSKMAQSEKRDSISVISSFIAALSFQVYEKKIIESDSKYIYDKTSIGTLIYLRLSYIIEMMNRSGYQFNENDILQVINPQIHNIRKDKNKTMNGILFSHRIMRDLAGNPQLQNQI